MTRNKPRNPYAFHPMMKKGGVHEKTETAKRRQGKQKLKHAVDEWLEYKKEKEQGQSDDCPFFAGEKHVKIEHALLFLHTRNQEKKSKTAIV